MPWHGCREAVREVVLITLITVIPVVGWYSLVFMMVVIPKETEHCRWLVAEDRLDWLTKRHPFIGASESAAVVNVSQFSSRYGVWYRKTGPVEDREPTLEQQVGHALEPLIAAEFIRESGVPCENPGDYCIAVSKRWPWLSCTPDWLTADCIPVELKTAKFDAAKEWKRRIPIAYQVQLTVQMLVLGVRESYIAVLLSGSDFKWHRFLLHDRFAMRLIANTRDFHERCLKGGERPATDESNATKVALASLYPNATNGAVELPKDLDSLGARYDRLSRAEAAIKKRKQGIQNRVKDCLGESSLGRLGDGSGFRWAGDKSRRFTRVKKVASDE